MKKKMKNSGEKPETEPAVKREMGEVRKGFKNTNPKSQQLLGEHRINRQFGKPGQ